MSGRKGLWSCLALVLAVPVAAQSTTGPIPGAATQPVGLRTTLRVKWERQALERALSGARRRLENTACQKLFSDFKDASGRTLQEELDALGQTGAGFMGFILFADGRGEGRCSDPRVLALTEPGSRAVWICGKRFLYLDRKHPSETEAVLIHEALHALGLGEDPPSSEAITRQVVARCGG